nr:unnamed protein product [Spirometra erinaceieuropaei]
MKKSLTCKFVELARSVPAKYVAVFPLSVQCLSGEVPPIPEPPVLADVGSTLNALGEPTFASLGLNSYWPSGWYQALLETLHVNLGFPWWLAIASTTLVIRLCLFPLIIDQRRKLASYTNAMPKIMVLQDRMTKARIASDYIEMMRISQQMQELMKTEDINPLRSMRLMVVQVPIFLSVFTGLRAMASLPVASMQTGGLAWFTDLTLCDPFYLLPLYSMTSIFLMFEFGADVSSQNMTPTIKMIMRAFPVVGFFMIMHMPSAVVWYWSISNTISIAQALILRYKPVRTYFKFPEVVPPPKAKTKKAGFVAGFRECKSPQQPTHTHTLFPSCNMFKISSTSVLYA